VLIEVAEAQPVSDGIYVSMNGASARLAQLDSVADNLANTETAGFKAERPAFEAFLARADSAESATKVYAAAVSTRVDLSPGTVVVTNNPMDVLPSGRSYLGVKTQNGIALTRNGHLTVDADGTLKAGGLAGVDREGNAIVAPPNTSVRIEPSGAVFADTLKVADLGLWEPQGAVDRIGPSLLGPQDPSTLKASDDQLHIGQVEHGNASALEAMVQLVTAQRSFETSLQALQTYKHLDDRATDVGRVR
jgi:flagellar basal-body rod protein FlgF